MQQQHTNEEADLGPSQLIEPPFAALRVAEWKEVVAPETFAQRVRRRDQRAIAVVALCAAVLFFAVGIVGFAMSTVFNAFSTADGHSFFGSAIGVPIFISSIGIYIVFLIVAFAIGVRYRGAGKEIGDMMDLPPAVPQFPVRMTLSGGETLYGSDRGVAAFVDHRLVFHGKLTSFDICRADAIDSSGMYQRNGYNRCQLQLSGGPKNRKVTFYAYDRLPLGSDGYQAAFNLAFRNWCSEMGGFPRTSLLPPRAPSPKTVHDAKRAILTFLWIPLVSLLTAVAPFVFAMPFGPLGPLNFLFFNYELYAICGVATLLICIPCRTRYRKLVALVNEDKPG